MISQSEIQKTAKQWNLEEHVIEKDYVLGWLLWGIAGHDILSRAWVLKGGSAIKKGYVDTHRYSQDLDFTALPGGPWQPDELKQMFKEILPKVSAASGVNFSPQEPQFELRPHGGSCEGRVYYIGPRGNPTPAAAKLDITQAEDLMRPPVLRSISHPYSDRLPEDTRIYCYSLEELFAEKIRALRERARPGDLYDIIYLFRRSDLNAAPELIREVLEYKCEFKEIPFPQNMDICTPERRGEVEARWRPMLGKTIGFLPALDDYWQEIPIFFAWLNGEDYESTLLPVNSEEAWHPVTLDWHRGQNELIEPIRYAAVNRLLINLGYKGKFRLVEPYSLRLTQAGHILFFAINIQAREIRAYRLDRIQNVEVTQKPFRPLFRIEFTSTGRIPTPFTQRTRRFFSSHSEHRYIIECAICGKHFYRSKYSTRINAHLQKDTHTQCSGRYGFLA